MRILVFLFLICSQVSAQELIFNKGAVMDSLPVNDSINETYALYLPMEFDGKTPMPIIFIFDEQGRGIKTARLFKSIAEQQGYILASSNAISGERTLKENVLSAARLIQQLTSILPIDYEQISVTGFGEGAKVATSLPLVFENIFGVMPVGNKKINFEHIENKDPFLFVGITGDESFGLYGMELTVQTLNHLGFPSLLYTFNGGGEWPGPGIISSAVGSLSLNAMKNKLRPVNQSLIKTLYEQDLDRANKLISNQKYLEADRFLELLQNKYANFINLSEIKDKLQNLRSSRNYIERQKEFESLRNEEMRLIEDYIYFFDEDIATTNFENLGWWDYQKIQLTKLTEGDNEAKANMAHRLLDLMDLLIAQKIEILEEEDAPLELKLLAYMVQTIFDQKDFEAYKNIISLSAKDDDINTALFYLEEMLKNGYADSEALYDIEGTLALRLSPKFNWLIEKYLGNAKYYHRVEN